MVFQTSTKPKESTEKIERTEILFLRFITFTEISFFTDSLIHINIKRKLKQNRTYFSLSMKFIIKYNF